jgi:hypothetical protein
MKNERTDAAHESLNVYRASSPSGRSSTSQSSYGHLSCFSAFESGSESFAFAEVEGTRTETDSEHTSESGVPSGARARVQRVWVRGVRMGLYFKTRY